jgi:hypothetical protein
MSAVFTYRGNELSAETVSLNSGGITKVKNPITTATRSEYIIMAEIARGIFLLINHLVPGSSTEAITTAARMMSTRFVSLKSVKTPIANNEILNNERKLTFHIRESCICIE